EGAARGARAGQRAACAARGARGARGACAHRTAGDGRRCGRRRESRLMRARSLLAIAAALGASACTMGPDYARPAVDVPTAYRTPTAPIAADEGTWWKAFGDP